MILSALLAAAGLAVSTGVVAGGDATADEQLEYVALGASFSAGVGIPSPVAGAPAGCGRSTSNFPRLVAEEQGYRLTDMSCGGAQTRHLASDSQTAGQPPQFQALSEDTDIVTMQIGYNDGNVYSGPIADCARSGGSSSSQAAPCEAGTFGRYSAAIQITAGAIATAIQGIKTRAPAAEIYVLGYPAIYPQKGSCRQNPFSATDTAFLDRLERELNTMLETQARGAGVTFVDTYTPSVGHDSCKARGTRWVEPYNSPVGAIRLHPNAAGHRQMAKAVLRAIE